jgi:DNA polymerase III subunit alpha
MFGILYLQSSYSMLKNTIPLNSLIHEAKKANYDFVALSDDNLHGMLTLFNEAKKSNLKPVLGLKIKVKLELFDTGFLVYVKNEIGYKNLLKLSYLNHENNLSYEDLMNYNEGLIIVSSGIDSVIDQHIMKKDLNQSKHYILKFKNDLKEFYLGMSLDTFDHEMMVASQIYQLSENTNVIILPIHQTSYLDDDSMAAYAALIKIDNESNEIIEGSNYQFLNQDELKKLFLDYPFVFDNLEKVISKITFNYENPKFEMPVFEIEKGSSKDYLKSLSILGLKKRLSKYENPDHKIYQDRLLYELKIINQMGFDNYFLIVYDFVKYAKTHDILVGPGRGSSAGSLVAFCLGITDVDPIYYDLLFERFLNPERITMPDIDMDFPDNKRDEVLQYVKNKYGDEHVVSIVTFGTFALKSSIRDIARVMKIDISRVSGIISNVINDKIDETDYETVRLLKVAKSIEGLPRHKGTHAAGMIFSKQNLLEHIPLQKGINGFYQSQLEASDLESLGLLKIDFLGIRNLTIIDDVVKQINGLDKRFTLSDIDYQDKKTYELLSQSETSGIFQLESSGMRQVLRKLKPYEFEDIVAILALYRPGPMDHIDEYIERRNKKVFSYYHKDLEPILKNTYGIIIYQEQIMKIASLFASYTLAEADLLRRGISKKDKSILEKERIRFVANAIKNGYDLKNAEEIYDYIVKFADYGFNRSHSVSYAIVAYQMAYLKANYFPIFMTVLLSSVTGNENLTIDYLNELKKKQVKVLPPDINLSGLDYKFIDNTIYLPLLSIKSIGRLTVDKILTEKNLNGLFKDYQDFKLRMKKEINEKNLEMLIHSGALDIFSINHQTMMLNKQIDNAGYEQYITDYKMKTIDEYQFLELAAFEKEALGFNLKYHPIQYHQELIEKHHLKQIADLNYSKEALILAYITKTKTIKTKQGKQMAFVELEDGTNKIEATLFANTYEKYQDMLTKDIQIFHIRENLFNNQKTYLIESIKKIGKL